MNMKVGGRPTCLASPPERDRYSGGCLCAPPSPRAVGRFCASVFETVARPVARGRTTTKTCLQSRQAT
ncbi:unnamed protein product [Amoebophrya sp. A120]|nr:unnamed protein product [Amoebophrya sp. A120]|eukprot:GSA120T00004664001.1